MEICGECRYWERVADGIGECRRRAPSRSSVIEDGPWPWATTFDDHWCGEWASIIPGQIHRAPPREASSAGDETRLRKAAKDAAAATVTQLIDLRRAGRL